ncbi:inositol-pentakisphosphate 2-kinase IPK1-like [Zingiber officinale]|uniref:inositol-pentakisphosphate 2-kinase IPK1-like n=1 Tax=Zingiber officinale TaxID=94328 RepID=UPI001C4BA309|nr:inositol-pentakisphosphate 2-kinase IPK1-like [Zingiber officinale]
MSHHRQEEHAILRESDAKDWFYKGEGAANLVLGYSGSSPSLVGKVLRIQKSARQINLSENGCLVLSDEERLIWGGVDELVKSTSKEAAARAFVQCVMTNYLDSKHIDPGIPIPVSKEFLEAVEMNINSQRPTWRVAASNIDNLCGSALLISDHSIISGAPKSDFCFAVEIKPKCGFLPSSEYIAEANSIKKHVTRFKMHQFLKLHQGEVSQVSGYDPLDLFSGTRDRMLLAITALFTSPQNNFRIFMNGSLIYGGLGGGADNNSVLSPKTENAIADLIAASGLQLVSLLELTAEILLRSEILHRLLATQKMDILDIEGAIHLYYNIISQPCSVCKNLSKAEVLHKYSSLHSLPLEKSLKIVGDYLIAATAKDCSLMISFRPSEDGHSASNHDTVFSKSINQSYDYKAYYIDLDLKPLKKMIYYYQLDQKIVNFYKMNQEIQGKVCCSGNGAPTAKH